MSNQYYIRSFSWSLIAKIIEAIVGFVTIPILIAYFGENDFGLLTIALATNAYMQILDLGISTGAVKFFSEWKTKNKYELIQRVAGTSITFYGIIGLINALILILISIYGKNLFQINHEQFEIYRVLVIITALFTVFNWITSVFSQLLIADEEMSFIQKITISKAILIIINIFITLSFKFNLIEYYSLLLIINTVIIVPYIYKCKRKGLIKSILPKTYWKDFKVIMNYSIAIFAMGIFQLIATKSRPLILGSFTSNVTSTLTEHRIIEVFPLFILSVGGVLLTIILPKAANMIASNSSKKIEELAYNGTKFTTILVLLMSFPIILNSKEILTLYVGENYISIGKWLALWCITLVLFLHNSPVASLVLATGKTKMLVFSSSIASVLSIIINALLAPIYGVGSAVIGYLIYIIIQMSFYYLYFNGKVLGLESLRVFMSFLKPTLIATGSLFVVKLINMGIENLYAKVILSSIIWFCIFVLGLFVFKIISIKSIKGLLNFI